MRNKYFARVQDNTVMDIDPFDDWLSSAPVVTSSDPITYWTGQEQSGHPLARMALDFLSIPGADLFSIFLTELISSQQRQPTSSDRSHTADLPCPR